MKQEENPFKIDDHVDLEEVGGRGMNANKHKGNI